MASFDASGSLDHRWCPSRTFLHSAQRLGFLLMIPQPLSMRVLQNGPVLFTPSLVQMEPLLAECCNFRNDGKLECSKICAVKPEPCEPASSRRTVAEQVTRPSCLEVGGAPPAPSRRVMLWIWILEVASGVHCTIEGIVSIVFAARNRQLSLLLFGLDSVIEVAAVLLVMWRLSGRHTVQRRERIATGGIGVLLILLTAAAVSASIGHLVQHDEPETALAGLIVSCISFVDMLCFWSFKRHFAKKIQSKCLASDATCSLACSLLGAVLFLGSILFLVHPATWWADAAAALLLSVFIAKEGVGMLRNACSASFEIGGCC
ncbi:TPA: hypothetical protein ACH3X2_009184 [Trebouxia sp. C0005]